MARFVFDVDDGVHMQFKVLCAKNGVSMQGVITDMMRKCIEAGLVNLKEIEPIPLVDKTLNAFDVAKFRSALGLKTVKIIDDLDDFNKSMLGKSDKSIPPFLRKAT